MNNILPPNTKFAAITLNKASARLTSPVLVSEQMAFFPKLPFTIAMPWKEWIGTMRTSAISEANLILLVTRPSANPSIVDHENQFLQKQVLQLLYATFLSGIPAYEGMVNFLTGANVGGEIEVRQVSRLPHFLVTAGSAPFQLTDGIAREAGQIAQNIELIYASDEKYIRLRRGLKVFLQGLEESAEYDRLHQFVRSIDALLMTQKGRGKEQFLGRGLLFTQKSAKTEESLTAMYELRGCVEHLNDWDPSFPGLSENERIAKANYLTRQAETLARHIYRHILARPNLRTLFETTESLEKFWDLPEDDQLKMWPSNLILDLDAIPFVAYEKLY